MVRIEGLKLAPGQDEQLLRGKAARLLRVPEGDILSLQVLRRAIDAREELHFVYTAAVTLRQEKTALRRIRDRRVTPYTPEVYRLPETLAAPETPPVVIGAGPGGLFAALVLARCGLRPIILERGRDAVTRQRDVEAFWRTGVLDPESNVQFGEGGAGAFSDGKLNTGTRDIRHRWILEQLAACGAPESILTDAKPHVGTDMLHVTLVNLRRQLLDLGAQVRFGHRVTGLRVRDGALEGLDQYEIIYGWCEPGDLKRATALKWYCCGFAGVDQLSDDSLYASPDVVLSNSSGAYGLTISEHILMVTLMLLRRMPEFQDIVRRREWVSELPMRSIYGSRITVLGAGDIGTNFARRAKALGAGHICGVSRSGRNPDPAYDRMLPQEQLDQVLPETEILVMALPSVADTVGILSRERIALLPRDAIVVNVGRGTAIDQEALMEALNAGRIAGAALDVVVPEPLPREHPLWSTRNLLLTPHISGNMSLGYTCDINVDMFCRDLENYAAGRPLEHRVDRKRGY